MSRLVILDEYDANFDHIIPADYFSECADEIVIRSSTKPEELLSSATGADFLISNKVRIDASTIAGLPDLRYIGVLATGYNTVDIKAARETGITVTNIPSYSSSSVAQLVFAHLLNLCREVQFH